MSDVAFRLRATRAAPPGAAADDDDRRATYGAALAQFDELMLAAESVAVASRPLPLFYALSQAGRAIAAAHADECWRLRRHGLFCSDLSGEATDVIVRPDRYESKDRTAQDSFGGVAASTKGDLLTRPVPIGQLWASLPEISQLLPTSEWVRPLRLVPVSPEGKVVDYARVHAHMVGFGGEPEELPGHLREHFPTAGDIDLFQVRGLQRPVTRLTEYGRGIEVVWPAQEHTVQGLLRGLQGVAPDGIGFEPRWLRPAVGGVNLSPLLTWWGLLFALSMLARYEPAGWTAALDLDHSELAAPLRHLLDIALTRVPELVLGALLDASARTL
jgi:hypothetical protein